MNKLLTIGTGVALLGLSSCACAAMVTINDGGVLDGTEVGFVDTFIEAADKKDLPNDQSGNELSEENWVNSVLSPNDTVSWTVKNDPVTYYSTDAVDTYAFSLMDSDPRPDYFLVKNASFQALFENEAYVGYGVFDINDIVDANDNLIDMNLATEGFTISHVTEFTSDGGRGLCNPSLDPTCGPTVVPIPPAIWLFGAGLIGLVGVARRKA